MKHYQDDLVRGLLKNLTLYGTGRKPDVAALAERKEELRARGLAATAYHRPGHPKKAGGREGEEWFNGERALVAYLRAARTYFACCNNK